MNQLIYFLFIDQQQNIELKLNRQLHNHQQMGNELGNCKLSQQQPEQKNNSNLHQNSKNPFSKSKANHNSHNHTHMEKQISHPRAVSSPAPHSTVKQLTVDTPQQHFFAQLKYHSKESDPIEDQLARIYLYKETYIHKKQGYFETKEQMQQHAILLCVLARAPAALQRIYHTGVDRDLTRCSVNNYKVEVYADHLNYTLKQHLDYHRARGSQFIIQELFYLLRELCELSVFLQKKKLAIRSFDPKDLYIDSQYCVKVPLAGVVALSHTHHHPGPTTIQKTMRNQHQIDATNLNRSDNFHQVRHHEAHTHQISLSKAPMTSSYICGPPSPTLAVQHHSSFPLKFSSVSIAHDQNQRLSSLYLAPQEISPLIPYQHQLHQHHQQQQRPWSHQTLPRQTQHQQNGHNHSQPQNPSLFHPHHSPHPHTMTMSPTTKANASRVFSLGMLLLQCLTLLDGAVSYYNYNDSNPHIDYHHLNNEVKNIQNDVMGALVSRMLQVDPVKRITFKQLIGALQKLEPQMFQESFLID